VEYEWDEAKRLSNLAKHGVDFTSMATFGWESAARFPDSRKPYGEERWLALGMIGTRLHAVTFTSRSSRVRIIRLRKANNKEIADMGTKPRLARNSPEEEAAIRRGIDADPDTWELTEGDWAHMRPVREAQPELVAEYRRTRGQQKRPTKVLVSLRLERDIVERLRASGPGWQGRANDMLRKAVMGA